MSGECVKEEAWSELVVVRDDGEREQMEMREWEGTGFWETFEESFEFEGGA